MKKRLALALALTVAAAPASAATFTATLVDNVPLLFMNGPIVQGDTNRLTAALTRNTVSHVVLRSTGGNLVEGLAMALLIRRAGLSTIVSDVCASACFTVFLAGKERRSFENSCLGIHHVSLEGRTHAGATLEMASIYKTLDVPPGIIGKMVTTEPDTITWLTSLEMLDMQVILMGRHKIKSPFSCN